MPETSKLTADAAEQADIARQVAGLPLPADLVHRVTRSLRDRLSYN